MRRENYIKLRVKWIEFSNVNEDQDGVGPIFKKLDTHFGVDGTVTKNITSIREDI